MADSSRNRRTNSGSQDTFIIQLGNSNGDTIQGLQNAISSQLGRFGVGGVPGGVPGMTSAAARAGQLNMPAHTSRSLSTAVDMSYDDLTNAASVNYNIASAPMQGEITYPAANTTINQQDEDENQNISNMLGAVRAAAQGHAHTTAHGHTHDGRTQPQTGPPPQQQQPDWRVLIKWMEHSGPFAILMFIKLAFEHRLGILLFIGLLGTFYYANRKLEQEIYNSMVRDSGQRRRKSQLMLIGIIVFLCTNIAAIYIVFSGQHLYRSLIFLLPVVERVDFWTLAWIVIITDFIIKFSGMILKSLLALVPSCCLQHKKRGKYYMFVEQVCQFYRVVMPIVPWLYFLANGQEGGQWFAGMLLVIYIVAKSNLLYRKSKELYDSYRRVIIDMVFGTRPSSVELVDTGDTCAICHDEYQDPVKLSCNHIFCEDCVSIWFDREKTCPICRAHITDNPAWRDGSTSSHLQWY